MANTLKPKRRSADGTLPTTADLADGEMAVNTVARVVVVRVGAAIQTVANYFSGAWADVTGKPTTLTGYGITDAAPLARTISTTAPLTGGGDLSANRTLAISPATTSAAGSMSAADKLKLDGLSGGGATANIPRNLQNGNYTFVAGDLGSMRYKSNSTAYTYTVDASVFAAGDVFYVSNEGTANNITIAQGSGVSLTYAGAVTAGNRIVTPGGVACVMMTSASAGKVFGAGVA